MSGYNDLVHAAYALWDLVVVTAMDNAQKDAYEQLINDHIERWTKPEIDIKKDVENKFVVIADPPGRKVGNGGSTIHVLISLHRRFGEALFEKKILLIHAGGYSQRMPSSSALGKLFIMFPSQGDQVRSMLEVKLLLSAAFVHEAPNGVLLMSADDIEVYDFAIRVPRDFFSETGFTAVAHPTEDIDVASKHGVYVIDPTTLQTLVSNRDQADGGDTLATADCVRVLQKPTESRMREAGAFLNLQSGRSAEIKEDKQILTDSFFFFAHPVSRILLRIAQQETAVCDDSAFEIDAYADFLQALGVAASRDYIERAAVSMQQVQVRTALFEALHSCELRLLILADSAFYHVGTNAEYLEHVCSPQSRFFQALQLAAQSRVLADCWPLQTHEAELKQQVASVCCSLLRCNAGQHNACECELNKPAIVEFCCIAARSVRIGCRCIVSNVNFDAVDADFVVPSDTFAQTVAIGDGGSGAVRYVTLFCGVGDDLKATASRNDDLSRLVFCSASLADFLHATGLQVSETFEETDARLELWKARLFPVAASTTEAFLAADGLLRVVRGKGQLEEPLASQYRAAQRVSLAEALRDKDVRSIVSYRAHLRDAFTTAKLSKVDCATV